MNSTSTPDDTAALAETASHALAAAGQGDLIWGHVAVRDPEGRGVWIKAPGWGMEEVTRERLQLVSFDGEVLLERDAELLGALPPSRFVSIHRLTSSPGRGLITVRPDGYIGFRCQTVETHQLTAWLARIRARTSCPGNGV